MISTFFVKAFTVDTNMTFILSFMVFAMLLVYLITSGFLQWVIDSNMILLNLLIILIYNYQFLFLNV